MFLHDAPLRSLQKIEMIIFISWENLLNILYNAPRLLEPFAYFSEWKTQQLSRVYVFQEKLFVCTLFGTAHRYRVFWIPLCVIFEI
jgi:hypothetical protein